MTRVSIVIPAFRAFRHIRSSISSALSQTHSDLEVVVVDDGSDDGTADVVDSLVDPRLRLIRQSNLGQSAALNRGAAATTGAYIKFLDADDWLNPGHIEAQLAAISKTSSHLASCRWGYFVTSPESPALRREVTNKDYENPVDWIIDSMTRDEGMMGGWMWLIPRNVWNAVGGWNETLTLNNDFDFTVRLLMAAGGVRFAPDAVYSYREQFASTLSGQRTRSAMESGFRTTETGCQALLRRENSTRTRQACADRWQRWEYEFFPEHEDLAKATAAKVAALGGSSFTIQGGRALRILTPIIGWRAVRKLQYFAYGLGWQSVLRWKARQRLKALDRRPW